METREYVGMQAKSVPISRRVFLQASASVAGGIAAGCVLPACAANAHGDSREAGELSELPQGATPAPVALPHFPSRLHAFVWRNWPLVPVERLARVTGATPEQVVQVAAALGLPRKQYRITADQQRRSYITVIKRNWHLLPYEQLLQLLGWTPRQLAYTLREDDFLFIKLGNLKPKCEPLRYQAADEGMRAREQAWCETLREEFDGELPEPEDSLFGFVERLSEPPARKADTRPRDPKTIRFCYSYFALYGDPLLETEADPYPEGLLGQLSEVGVTGVWLQAVLYKLAPFPWDAALSAHYAERLENLRKLVRRARRHGIQVFLYLNEPRAMPLRFFAAHPDLKGVTEGDHATLCTSQPAVREYLTGAIASICRAVPDLGGFFTITASENLTSCWSHHAGNQCPRCKARPPGEVIAEVNQAFYEGIQRGVAGDGKASKPRLIAWDWGWADAWAPEVIARLPQGVALMSVSEWSLPIRRGGIDTTVGEYSISAVGPGPRAMKHWELARKRGMPIFAKIQAGNTWELSAVPYIPALANIASHLGKLRTAQVDGIMLGWTLGGYPSPNLELATAVADGPPGNDGGSEAEIAASLRRVAARRFGSSLASAVVQAWEICSRAFREFPYHIGVVYNAPLQSGPSNLLWKEPTGYRATMVGFPYDDLDTWRSIYPPDVFAGQLEKVADGFEQAWRGLQQAASLISLKAREQRALAGELNVMEAAGIHFRSVAQQTRFVMARNALQGAKTAEAAASPKAGMQQMLKGEIQLARRLFAIQARDSRVGFEASNQYYYVPLDLVEKVMNCRDLLQRLSEGNA